MNKGECVKDEEQEKILEKNLGTHRDKLWGFQ